MIKLHLGCGMRHIPGFIHIDIIDAEHIDFSQPVEDLSNFEDNSVDLIYASHVLEHFGRHDVENVLKEWHRVLKKNGIVRIAVPNFAAVVDLYCQEGLQDGYSGLVGLVCGGQKDLYDYHKIIFDKSFLTSLLKKVGFTSVREWDWRLTEHTDLDDYSQAFIPHMDKENGRLMSLNVEGTK